MQAFSNELLAFGGGDSGDGVGCGDYGGSSGGGGQEKSNNKPILTSSPLPTPQLPSPRIPRD